MSDKTPPDIDTIVSEARALDAAGRHAEAVALLGKSLVNVSAHEESPMPSLSKRGIDPALGSVLFDGEEYTRLFAVAHGRVLYFWAPTALRAKHEEMARDVAERLAPRLAKKKNLRPGG